MASGIQRTIIKGTFHESTKNKTDNGNGNVESGYSLKAELPSLGELNSKKFFTVLKRKKFHYRST